MPRGGARPGAGRPKGKPNRVTADARAVLQAVFEEQAPLVSGWFASVAQEDPGRALDALLRLAEYHIPKLGRLELDLTKMTPEQLLAELERRAALGPGPS
jgi:hypothetical protein